MCLGEVEEEREVHMCYTVPDKESSVEEVHFVDGVGRHHSVCVGTTVVSSIVTVGGVRGENLWVPSVVVMDNDLQNTVSGVVGIIVN